MSGEKGPLIVAVRPRRLRKNIRAALQKLPPAWPLIRKLWHASGKALTWLWPHLKKGGPYARKLLQFAGGQILKGLSAIATGVKWTMLPFWGPLWMTGFVWEVICATALGRQTAETEKRYEEEEKLRLEEEKIRREEDHYLPSWYGFRKVLSGVWWLLTVVGRVFSSPFTFSRFLGIRFLEALVYVVEVRGNRRHWKRQEKIEERLKKEKLAEEAEKERAEKALSARRRDRIDSIVSALNKF